MQLACLIFWFKYEVYALPIYIEGIDSDTLITNKVSLFMVLVLDVT